MAINKTNAHQPDKRLVLIAERRSRNWTQQIVVEHLAANYEIKITRAHLSMIENHINNPSLAVLIALSRLYQRSIDDLV